VKRAFGAAGLLLTALLMLAGCNGNVAHGTVAGTLESEGGAAPGPPVPLPGRVVAATSAGARFTVTVGNNGRFRLSLPAGTYHLIGYSPMVRSNGAEMRCSAGHPVRVRVARLSSNVHVGCSIR